MNASLKILMVCKNLPAQYKGGIQTHTHVLATSLVEMGHQVTVLAGGSIFRKLYNADQQGYQIVELPYLPARYIPLIGLFLEELFFNINAWIYTRVFNTKFDMLHMQGRSGLLYALWPGKTPHVRTMHSLIRSEKDVHTKLGVSLSEKIYFYLSQLLELAMLRKNEKLIAVSETLKSDINQAIAHNANITVVPNGLRINNAQSAVTTLSKEFKTILFVGRLENTKGIHDFLQLAALANGAYEFVIVGAGSKAQDVSSFISSNPQCNVKHVGAQPEEVIRQHMLMADVLVLPSYYETQGIVLLEAQLHGLPIIASQLPAVSEHIIHGYNGLLFEAGKIWQMKFLLEVLFRNPALMHRLCVNGRRNIETNYNMQLLAKTTEEIYIKAIA
jgi:glycosyltransferase involved in cell wall biosynthesis